MPSRHTALGLVALAAIGLTTGCEKQSPYITLTAHGVTVKARAQKYCREGKCAEGKSTAFLTVGAEDILGIDVPRSVAEDGWRLGGSGDFHHDHYLAIPLTGRVQPGQSIPLQIARDETHGIGEWLFTIKVK